LTETASLPYTPASSAQPNSFRETPDFRVRITIFMHSDEARSHSSQTVAEPADIGNGLPSRASNTTMVPVTLAA
jgi:hypothetical protein